MDYTDTTGELARQGAVSEPTIRRYADLGLLDFVVIRNGVRLFRSGQADRVRDIYQKRMASRGRPKSA